MPFDPDAVTYRFRHERAISPSGRVSPKGGRTFCDAYMVVEGDRVLVATGVAVFASYENYNKRLGRTIAHERAVQTVQQALTYEEV